MVYACARFGYSTILGIDGPAQQIDDIVPRYIYFIFSLQVLFPYQLTYLYSWFLAGKLEYLYLLFDDDTNPFKLDEWVQKLILFLQYDVRCVFLDKSVSIVRTFDYSSQNISRSTHLDVILFQILLNDLGYEARYCKLFFYPNKLYYLQTSQNFHIIPFRISHLPEHCGLVNDAAHIPASTAQSKITQELYHRHCRGAMKKERRRASVSLLLVRQLSIRTNAILLVKVPPTPLPPLPKFGEINRDVSLFRF